MSRMLPGYEFIAALRQAGVIGDRVRRVVLDAKVDSPVVLYVENYGDDALLDIGSTLDGVRVVSVQRDVAKARDDQQREAGS